MVAVLIGLLRADRIADQDGVGPWYRPRDGERLQESGRRASDADGAHDPGEWLEHQPWLNLVVVVLGGGLPRVIAVASPSLASAITLDRLNLFFLTLGFLLHRTPARLMNAFRIRCHPPGA